MALGMAAHLVHCGSASALSGHLAELFSPLSNMAVIQSVHITCCTDACVNVPSVVTVTPVELQ